MGLLRALFLLPAVLLVAVLSSSSSGPPLDIPIVEAAGSPAYGGVLYLASTANPGSCDLPTTLAASSVTVIACAPMLNQLVKYDPLDPKVIVSDAAQSWELSGDFKTWTFHLKPGIKWHNGATLTSEDAMFSLQRIIAPPAGVTIGETVYLLPYIQQMEIPDNLTLRITTAFPAPSLLANLASVRVPLYPKAATEALSPPSMQTPSQVVGSGPFKAQEYIVGVVTKLVRHPDYFVPDRPYLDGVNVYVVPDAATRLAALKTGQVHVIPFGVAASEAAGLEAFGVTVQQSTQNRGLALILNTTLTDPQFGPILYGQDRIRRSVNLALDRDALAAGLGMTKGDLMMPGGQWALPTATLLAKEGYGNKAAEIPLADQLLSEAGYPNGFVGTLMTTTGVLPDQLSFLQAAELVQAQLEAQPLNIDLTISAFDSATWRQKRVNKDYQAAISNVFSPLDDSDFRFSMDYLCDAPRNFTGLCNAQLETLFSQQQQELDPVARLSKARDLISYTMDQNAFLMLGWDKQRIPVRNVVADFQAHPNLVQNLRWQDVWFDLAPPSTPTPTPTPIPSLGQWGIVLLASFFGILMAWRLNRKPRASV